MYFIGAKQNVITQNSQLKAGEKTDKRWNSVIKTAIKMIKNKTLKCKKKTTSGVT